MRALGYVNRRDFIEHFVAEKRVCDCGAVGLTCLDDTSRLDGVPQSLHWRVATSAREAVALDTAADVVEAVAKRFPNLDLRCGSVENADTVLANEAPFEVVVLGDIIEHVDNAGRTIDAIRAVLTEEGDLLITCPNAFGLPNFLRFLAGRFREGHDHVAVYNKWTLANLLGRHGFVVIGVWTALDREPDSPLRRYLYALFGLGLRAFPELGGTLVVHAKRVIGS